MAAKHCPNLARSKLSLKFRKFFGPFFLQNPLYTVTAEISAPAVVSHRAKGPKQGPGAF
jgi:hypothetical protein